MIEILPDEVESQIVDRIVGVLGTLFIDCQKM